MTDSVSTIARFGGYFGAHHVAQREENERQRGVHRGVASLGICVVWLIQYVTGESVWVDRRLTFSLILAYGIISLTHAGFLHAKRSQPIWLQYFFLVLDPIFLIVVMTEDAQTFAFLNPFLLVVIVPSGIRYGIRTMYLSWVVTICAAPLLLTNEFWRTNVEMTFSLFLMLAFVPMFFSSLIRQVHNVRAIEVERARLAAMNEVVVARSSFLAKISHELRSPLQSMVSALDVFEMRHARANPDDEELIGRMRRSSLLLNTQLRDLLTLAKGEAGRLELRPEPFEVLSLVHAMSEGAEGLARTKGLALVVNLPSQPVFVTADGARIDQVLTNLVTNSIRYTDAGQVRITFSGHSKASGCLVFIVADTGPGIPQEVLPMLFAPDKMLSGAARRGEGSGIGLAIVRTLVDHLGGTVSVTSTAGRGTTFTVQIPAEAADDDAEDTVPGEPTGRLLVVDDRADVLDALIGVVDQLGYECDRAGSAAIAANLLAARTYDAVLVDIDMPVKPGDQLTVETRRGNGPNRDSRFIAMSAAEGNDEMRSHFHTWLGKPIDRSELRQALIGIGHFSRPSQPGLWTEAD